MLTRDQPVISIDLASPPGIGDPKDLTVEHLERQVVAVIEAECPGQQVDLLGYSLGAVVAAAIAGHHPQLIGTLVLVAGWMKTDKHQQLRNRLWFALRNANHEDALRLFMGLSSRSPMEVITVPSETLEAQLASIRFTPFLDQMMDLNQRIDIRDAVAAILAPTLIIAGSEDQMVPVHHAKAMF
ncbi:alpha beta hydrolase family protein, partial [Lasius niger]